MQRIWYNLYSATILEGRYPCFRLRGNVGGVTSVELWRLNLYWSRKYVEYQRWVDTLRLQYCLIYCVEYHYQHAAWRGDDVFLDCTNPRLSLCGDIVACAWRLCCVKQAAICLEIYAGDCVCILCWWSCKDYIGAHRGAVKTTLATIVGDCLREGPVKTVCWRIVCCLWLRWYNTCCWYFHFESSSLYAAVNPNFLK